LDDDNEVYGLCVDFYLPGSSEPSGPANHRSTGHLNTTTDRVLLLPGATTLFDADGSALVIHADRDDQVTDPTGNSGGRVACGVVEGE